MNFKKFFKDLFYDTKHGRSTASLGRIMVGVMFLLALYQWVFVGADIFPNFFSIFSSLLLYVLGTKGINSFGRPVGGSSIQKKDLGD